MVSQSRTITGVKTYNAIGMVELSSIAKGMQVTDFMLKSANVGLLMAKTVCPEICGDGGRGCCCRDAGDKYR